MGPSRLEECSDAGSYLVGLLGFTLPDCENLPSKATKRRKVVGVAEGIALALASPVIGVIDRRAAGMGTSMEMPEAAVPVDDLAR